MPLDTSSPPDISEWLMETRWEQILSAMTKNMHRASQFGFEFKLYAPKDQKAVTARTFLETSEPTPRGRTCQREAFPCWLAIRGQ